MTETIDQIAVGVRILLRNVSDIKLPQADIIERINDNLRGKIQDMKLGGRERLTRTVDATVTSAGVDFTISAAGAADAEVEKLEYGGSVGLGTIAWQEARVVPLQAYARAFDQGGVVAAFYGKNKVKLNMVPRDACGFCWRITFRESLLAVLASGAPIPLPGEFVPMLKKEVALDCAMVVQDDTDGWIAWMDRTLPQYRKDLLRWTNPDDPRHPGRWDRYLIESNEPQIQNIRPANSARLNLSGRVGTRAYLPRGSS